MSENIEFMLYFRYLLVEIFLRYKFMRIVFKDLGHDIVSKLIEDIVFERIILIMDLIKSFFNFRFKEEIEFLIEVILVRELRGSWRS